eukprot:scaffold135843_cov15-Tisochrysis_lutea.AAC.1
MLVNPHVKQPAGSANYTRTNHHHNTHKTHTYNTNIHTHKHTHKYTHTAILAIRSSLSIFARGGRTLLCLCDLLAIGNQPLLQLLHQIRNLGMPSNDITMTG